MNKAKKSKDSIKLKEVRENLLQAHIIGKMGSWKWDLVTGKVEWSKMMYDIFKIDSEDKSTKLEDAIENVIHPDDLHIVRASNAESFKPDNTVQYRIIWPDKSIRYIMAHTGEVVKDHKGIPIYINGMVQDITDEIMKETELKDSEERFSLMFSKHSSIMLLIDESSGRIIDANLAAQNFYGYEIESLRSMTIAEINVIHEDNLKLERRKASREEDNYFVFTHRLKNGKLRTVEVHSSPIDYKGSTILFSIIHDITEKNKMEILLRNERRRLSNIIEATNVGTWELNIETEELKLNQRWAEIIGYTLEELYPTNASTLSKLIHPDDFIIAFNLMEKLVLGEIQYYDIEMRIKHKSGKWVWVQNRAKAFEWIQDIRPNKISGTNMEITERKNIEIALKESENNFHTFFETIGDIILVASKEGEIFYSNASAQNKLGYSCEELQNMHVLDLNSIEKRAEAEQIFGDMFSGKTTICRLPLVRKDGKEIPSETRIWFGKWNGKECIFSIIKDISAEQFALDKFQKVFMSNPTPMAINDFINGRFTDVNNSFLQTLEYTREEIVGKTSTELKLYIDHDKHSKGKESLIIEGSINNIELEIRKKNGEIMNGLFFGEILENANEKTVLTTMLEVTESRKILGKLKESEQSLKQKNIIQNLITNSLRDLININSENIDGKMSNLLKKVGEFLEVERGYIFRAIEGNKLTLSNEWYQNGISPIGLNNHEIPFENSELWSEEFKKANMMYLTDIAQLNEEKQIVKDFLRSFKIKSALNVKIMKNDKLYGFLGFASTRTFEKFDEEDIELLNIMASIVSDTFAKVNMEEELIAAKQKAEADNVLKTDFLINMSHELRTPINVMRSSIQLLELKISKLEDEESKKILKQLKLMNRNSMRITRLVNNIIYAAKLDSGFYEPSFENADIIKIIRRIFLSINQYAKYKKIKLIFEDGNEEIFIKCDVLMIEKIILNIISNAIKYSKKSGYIKISVDEKPKTIAISIKDNGIGIEKDMQEIIFERYRQANPKLLQKSEGSGIGLSLAKSLAEIHGGKIQVISQYGEGSEFIVELPKTLLEDETSASSNYDNNTDIKVFMANMDIEMADLESN